MTETKEVVLTNTKIDSPISIKRKGKDKFFRAFPIKTVEVPISTSRKPDWIRVRLNPTSAVNDLKETLRANKLVTVCEEASCPNLSECFGHGTATFMIMGDICTRRCYFCDVGHGRPKPLNEQEPLKLAETIHEMGLKYVVITSVDRDDLSDGGAHHFAQCIDECRKLNANLKIEILVPDFRGRAEKAIQILGTHLPDVFNHNIETAPRLYKKVRPGSNYQGSLELLKKFKEAFPTIPTKSGMMLGLGETTCEVEQVMADLRQHHVEMLTLGQYLQPSRYHAPVDRYVHPDEFARLAELAKKLGFKNVASGPLVRSSYHADRQAQGEMVS